MYYIDKCMPMGWSISCSPFEVHGLTNIDNYLDALFLAEMSDIECSNNMSKFKAICKRLGVPIADEKTECPVTSMNYFGLTINNESIVC